MKIVSVTPQVILDTTIAFMPRGSVGVTKDGKIYVRGYDKSAICLTDVGQSYESTANDMDTPITLYAPGTTLTFKVNTP